MKAKLLFLYETRRESEAVVNAVSPDNVGPHSGLTVKTLRKANRLVATVHCTKSLETFAATLDDLLACISVAEKAFAAVKAP